MLSGRCNLNANAKNASIDQFSVVVCQLVVSISIGNHWYAILENTILL